MFRNEYVPGTIEDLEQKIQKAQDKQEIMKCVNAYYRKNKTLEGCPNIDEESLNKINKRLSRSGEKPFSAQTLRFNLNSIKDNQNLLRRQKALRDAGDGWTFNGGRIVIDREKGDILLCDYSDEVHERIKKIDAYCHFYSTTPDGTPRMMYFEHLLPGLLEMTRKYDEMYPAESE